MICPNCKTNSIAFLPVWLKGSFGSQTCSQCGLAVTMKRTAPVVISSALIGLVIALAPLLVNNYLDFPLFGWSGLTVFLAVAVVALIIDGIKDYYLIELKTDSLKPNQNAI